MQNYIKSLMAHGYAHGLTKKNRTEVTAGADKGLGGRASRHILLVMKLTTILLLSACLTARAEGLAQGLTIKKTNAPLKEVFKAIEKQSDYNFFFNERLLKDTKKVTIDFKGASIEEVLDACFKGQPVTYAIVNKTIVVKKSDGDGSLNGRAKDDMAPLAVDVRGRVTSEDGEPVEGASVMVKGTSIGTTTDGDGFFELRGVDAAATLVISGVNIYTREVSVDGKTNLSIAVRSKVKAEEEVVVKTNYWSVKQRENTGNISKVTAATIEKQPVTNPLQNLQGRVPGIYIDQASGIPGAGFEVRIRGVNSIASGNNPLYIIDGVPFISQTLSDPNASFSLYGSLGVSPLNSINPSDIESIEVLKDADATAIYGSRGANGVILITTKRGKPGKLSANVNVRSGISMVNNRVSLMNTGQYIQMRMEAVANDGEVAPRHDEYDINGTWDQNRYTDWQEVLIGGKAPMTDVTASVSAGSNEVQFIFNTGYNEQGTVFPGDNSSRRFSAHFSAGYTSTNKKFSVNLSSNYIKNWNDIVSQDLTREAVSLAPNAPKLYDENGKLNWERKPSGASTWTNPIAYLANRFDARTNNLIMNAELFFSFFRGFSLKTNLGYNDIQNSEKRIFSADAYDPAIATPATHSRLDFGRATSASFIIEPQLNWEGKLGKGKIDALIGGSYQLRDNESSREIFRGFPSNALISDPRSAANFQLDAYNYSLYKYAALFGRINYKWEQKYILNITGRRDGSSRFGPGRQFANLGAAGVAWVFSKERFARHFSFLSFGKLRGSYGITGNDQIGDYNYLDLYRSGTSYQGAASLVPTQLFNPEYGWETNKKLEAALEIGLVNDRINVAFAFYRNRSSNQLVRYSLSTMTGYPSVLKNFPATVQNKGLELELSTINIKSNSVNWTSSLNVSFPRNELVAFPGLESSSYKNLYVIGMPLNIRKVYHYQGVDPITGLYKVEDVNGDGTITPDDFNGVIELGQKFHGGINNSVSYKGFQIDVFFQFVQRKRALYTSNYFPPGSAFTNQPVSVLENRWQKPGDDASQQKFSRMQSARISQDRFLASDARDGEIFFTRLKNVSLSYQLAEKLIPGIIGRVYLQGQNLLTFSGYDGLDPESGSESLPPLTTIVAGVQIGF